MPRTNTIAFSAAVILSVAVLNLGFVLAAPAAAQAQTVQLQLSEKYSNATHDPSRIWLDKDLKPFGSNPGKRGADITEYGAPAADGSHWLLSQILSEDCSLQLCPARLVKILPGGNPTIVVDDMMHIGGPFIIDGNILTNGDYQFPIGPSK